MSLLKFTVIILCCTALSQEANAVTAEIFEAITEEPVEYDDYEKILFEELLHEAMNYSRPKNDSFSWSSALKRWCGLAISRPISLTVSECARARVGAVFEATNLQEPRDVVLGHRLRDAKSLFDAARELGLKDGLFNANEQAQIEVDLTCISSQPSNEEKARCLMSRDFWEGVP